MPQPYPGQNWRHNWVPVTPAAVASKAKKGPPPPRVAKAAADAGEILRRMKRKDSSRRSVTPAVSDTKTGEGSAPTKSSSAGGSVGTSATGKPLKIGDRVQVVSGLGKGRTATIVGSEHGRLQVETGDGIRRLNDPDQLAHIGDTPSQKADDAIRKAAGRPAPAAKAEPKQETGKPPTVERAVDDIRSLYADLAPTTPTGRVSLVDLRQRLPKDLPRGTVDQALAKLNLQPDAHVTPQANQKILTPEDRAAAVSIGGQDKHFIEIESRGPAPAPRRTAPPPPSSGGSRDTSRQADEAIRRAAGRPSPTAQADERPRRQAPAQEPPRQSPPAPEPRTQAPQAGRAADKPAPKATPSGQAGKGKPVDGSPSDKPIARNAWGTGSAAGNEVAFHDDGAIGTAIKDMGADARMNVDGEPLANVLGKLATDGVAGRKSTQEMVDAVKNVRDRLPAGSAARRELDRAIGRMDAPTTPPPKVPDGALPPLAKLAQDLHNVPAVRNDPDSEMKPLLDLLGRFSEGKTGGRRVLNEVRALANKRHESLEGKAEIDRLVTRAVEQLERMQQADRTALYPPTRK